MYHGLLQSDVYIGVSRICCPMCALFVQAINHVKSSDGIHIYTHGAHQNTPSIWIFPEILVEDKEILADFLGGKSSKAFHDFVSMKESEKAFALTLVQQLSLASLRLYPELQELAQILIKPKSQHPLPEPSLTSVSDRMSILEVENLGATISDFSDIE